jgi:(R)-2-hydroxyacyl-CoA dehydratese activating ATPase
MISAGIDIGSRTVKVVLLENGRIVFSRKVINSYDPLSVCRELLQDLQYDKIVATGYGRHLFKANFASEVITEIKAFAIGARAIFGSCRTILDIGGQDIKTISLDETGRVRRFEMNDKCSAGTGRFLEIMATTLGCRLDEFSAIALNAGRAEKINSMCTVFAESEVISLLARGAIRGEVASGIHQAILTKAKSMLQRVSLEKDLVFVGGVALNPYIVKYLEESCSLTVLVPDHPQLTGAYGCALFGANLKTL